MLRPRVVINAAMSADGKIDTVERRGAAISSAADRERVDRLRADCDVVMVGGRTLLAEDPALTVRSGELQAGRLERGAPRNPAKVGIASEASIDPFGRFVTEGPARRILFCTDRTGEEQAARLRAAGVEVHVAKGRTVDLTAALRTLAEEGMASVLVEGGGTLIAELIRLCLVDELSIYVAPIIFGGASAPTLADGPGFSLADCPHLRLDGVERFDDRGGVLLRYTFASEGRE